MYLAIICIFVCRYESDEMRKKKIKERNRKESENEKKRIKKDKEN